MCLKHRHSFYLNSYTIGRVPCDGKRELSHTSIPLYSSNIRAMDIVQSARDFLGVDLTDELVLKSQISLIQVT